MAWDCVRDPGRYWLFPVDMEAKFTGLVSVCVLLVSSFIAINSSSVTPLLGVHPLDEKYYASEIIKCKDGTKVFSRDRLNDNYCDCIDGTDEPGTSACPAGRFYCRNLGSTPQFIFSSHVNDHFCDCCDGSDEYDGKINCQNTCIIGGNVVYKSDRSISTVRHLGDIQIKETNIGMNLDDLIKKLGGLKVVIILQLFVIIWVVVFQIVLRHRRAKRRRFR